MDTLCCGWERFLFIAYVSIAYVSIMCMLTYAYTVYCSGHNCSCIVMLTGGCHGNSSKSAGEGPAVQLSAFKTL